MYLRNPQRVTMVFTCYNQQGFVRIDYNEAKKKYKNYRFETGMCASMSSMFLRRMLDHGSVTEASAVGGAVSIRMGKGVKEWSVIAHQAAIAQAAYEFGTLKKGEKEVDKDALTRLLGAYGLKVERDLSIAELSGDTARVALQQLLEIPGYYLIGTPEHAMAIVTVGDKPYFFEPNEGLYQWSSWSEFVDDVKYHLCVLQRAIKKPLDILKVIPE
jgi:hypothetical protein